MYLAYLLSVWLHIMAAIVWIGGTIFMASALLPAIRRPEFAKIALPLVRSTAQRFRWVGWVCFAVFIITGLFNLQFRGVGMSDLQSANFWQSNFGTVLASKLVLVAVIIAASALHDFYIGPRAAEAWQADPRSPETLRLRRQAIHAARLNLLLALLATLLGVSLVRGAPW